ncbi:MAG: FAD-dependent oxidoreductase [Pseudomonadota bacterium]
MSARPTVAVVGSGISGLTAARALDDECDVTVFESGDYVGGHTRTLDVEIAGSAVSVDIGFIVFNDWTYPNFIAFLNELGVDSVPTSMGFSLSDERSGLEYRGGSWGGLFAQRRNALKPCYYRFLLEIKRFFDEGKQALESGDLSETFGEYIETRGYSKACVEQFILPMAGAIWSTEPARVREFPASFFLRFFANHGLLNLTDRPVWRTVRGGSRTYIDKLLPSLRGKVLVNRPVTAIRRHEHGVTLHIEPLGSREFDYVILACHSDQALALLNDASDREKAALAAIRYQDNEVVLHTDRSLLPKRRRAWAAWNYHLQATERDVATLTYSMNILQHLDTPKPVCVTLNASDRIAPSSVLHRQIMAHPLYTTSALAGQSALRDLSGQRRTAFAGAYLGNGFHEDGVVSGLAAASRIREAVAVGSPVGV